MKNFIFSFFAICFLVQCSGPQVKEVRGKESDPFSAKLKTIEPEARSLYTQAEKAFQSKNYDLALRLFSQIKHKHPHTVAAAYSNYRLGMIYYYNENYDNASVEFEAHLANLPQSDLIFDSTYNWAASEFQLGHSDKVLQILSKLNRGEVQAQGAERSEAVYSLVGKAAEATKSYSLAIKAFAYQLQLPLEDQTRAMVEVRVDDNLNRIAQTSVLEKLLDEVEEAGVRFKIQRRLALVSAPTELPKPATAVVANNELPSPRDSPRRESLSLNPFGSIGDGETIGVLLPLSGKAANYGKKALEGILVASEWLQKSGINYQLEIRDTQSSPYAALAELDDLIGNHRVMAVIGPIQYREAQLVSEKCQQQGVLNISLASKEGLSERGPYIFQNAITPRVQIENLVRFCMDEKKMKRFGILAPDNQFGKELSQLFWDEVESRGGHISAYQLYSPDESDFQKPIQELAGLIDPSKNRPEEWKRFSEFIQEEKKKTNREPKIRLSGIADFDGLFIPEGVKNMTQISPTLAFNDLAKVPVLGTTEWSAKQFLQRGGKYIETIYFPASAQLGSSNSEVNEFFQGFKDVFERSPELLASQSYEALWLIGLSFKKNISRDRNQIVQTLYQFKNLPSPLGTFEFDAKRIAKRKLEILVSKQGTLNRAEN